MSQLQTILCSTSDIMDVIPEIEDNSNLHSLRGERLVEQYLYQGNTPYNVYSTGVLEKAITMGTVYIGTTRRTLEPTDAWWRNLVLEENIFSTERLELSALKLLPYWDELDEYYTPDDVLITPALRQSIDEHAKRAALARVMDDSSFLWKLLFNHLEIDWPQEDYGNGFEDAHWATALDTAEMTYSHIVRGHSLKCEIRKISWEKYKEQTKRAV